MDALEVVNRGNIDIFQLDIKLERGGDSNMRRFKYNIKSGEATVGRVNLRMEDGEYPEKIIIYPEIIGEIKSKHSNSAFTCLKQGRVIIL